MKMDMKEQLGKIAARVDGLALRERALIFAAIAFLLVSLIDSLLLNPLLQKQKQLAEQAGQQQEKMKSIQSQIANLVQAKQADAASPQRERIRMLRLKIEDGDKYLKDRRDKLVPPERMAELLEQVLNKNQRLQLVALETLPVTLFIEPTADANATLANIKDMLMYKHGVRITVRGSYADLLQYLNALEHLPTQMFWGMAKLNVVEHPTSELTLTLYTLSLDKTWLQV